MIKCGCALPIRTFSGYEKKNNVLPGNVWLWEEYLGRLALRECLIAAWLLILPCADKPENEIRKNAAYAPPMCKYFRIQRWKRCEVVGGHREKLLKPDQ